MKNKLLLLQHNCSPYIFARNLTHMYDLSLLSEQGRIQDFLDEGRQPQRGA